MTTKEHDLNQAINCINNEDFSRKFDDCFENFNGDYVYGELLKLAKSDRCFADKIVSNSRHFNIELIEVAMEVSK